VTAPGRPPGTRPRERRAAEAAWRRFHPPRFGLGGGPIGEHPEPAGDVQAAATVDAAYGAGIRFYDTAPRHGLGLSERRLGTALARHPREDFLVSTRAGESVGPGGLYDDLSAGGIRRSLDQSLERLGMDEVDLLLVDQAEARWEPAYPILRELRELGVVRAIGAATERPDRFEPLVSETELDVVQLTGCYTLLDQSAESLLELCRERGVAVVIAGVFHGGMLSGQAGEPADPDLLIRTRRITAVCERYGVSLPQAALAFPARHPAVTSILIGAVSAAEIRTDVALVRQPVPPDLWRELTDQELIAPGH
jgi:D-threo-aldose 1-dehydrogenase